MEPKNLRLERGSESASQNGQGATYIIPADDVPEGIVSGEKGKLIIEGLFSIDDQGLIIEVDRISTEKLNSRTDPLQDNIERGLDIEIKLNK